jgi:PPOX class probable FMN-dependent enzyme
MGLISSVEQLEAIYGEVGVASRKKEIDYIHPAYAAMIAASPFCVLATSGPDGLDASPRGDEAGFVVVHDERTLMIPDRRGNNRIDSLKNVVQDPRVALLFLIPGIGETLRVNGVAAISVEPELIERFTREGKAPRSVLVVKVEAVFFQCSRAIVRSKLWDPATQIPRSALRSTGSILEELTECEIEGDAYDRELPGRIASTLY